MDWVAQFDGYCERVDFTYWSEPVNAVTNAAFLIAAIWAWRRSADAPAARLLAAILFLIGIGSYLFHTHATAWASMADVAPIGVFILTYLFLVNRHVMGWPLWLAGLGTLAFLPYAAVMVPLLDRIPFLRISDFYWTVPILLFLYAALLRKARPEISRGFVAGGLILCLSITVRSVDMGLCPSWPLGTHFGWHILNAVMLGWMIEVYRRHRLEDERAGR